MRRFCWRERSEKLNWRLLSALDVAEVLRRGDAAVLEPYALHVTFARLPTPKDPAIRDAWFLVRVLQLAMEYLLFMRTRDGDVLDSLSQELRQVEQERDEIVASEHKWKARARSGDKQVDKLHQVLQNIAKLLQIHGASPSAVATIETLLTELVAERRAKQKRRGLDKEDDKMQEAREIVVETPVKQKMKHNFVQENKENKVNEDLVASETAMQKMVQQVERALHEHEEKMRSLAEQETEKVKQMMKIELNQQAQQQLDEAYLQKELAENEVADLKQQIQFLTLKKKMAGTTANPVVPTTLSHTTDDALIAAKAEIKDLQHTLETLYGKRKN
ncbi:hypothetical protein PHMEG_00024792 [Phytophthora megakarya]|uniref:Cilium assembly protein DZIP1 N-terminal domain-containing protein n=1 Tax=Phytophthora megakarya TaxID=4795 RepID=A0A225VDT2_9STRA|nr:hypothetical protein PHMEG_00024792 [Phytophthora megakarya]